MSEPGAADVVIGSKRSKLVAQAAILLACGVGGGWLLESTNLLSSSPLGRFSETTGLPLIWLAVSGIAIAVAFVLARDSWNQTITLEPAGMRVTDHLGSYLLPYADVDAAKLVPAGGVVISVRDPEQWLASSSGDPAVRRRTAGVINARYGGHIWFQNKHLSIGTARFIALLQERMSGACRAQAPGQPPVRPSVT